MKGFSQIGVPLIDITKKRAFRWSKEVQEVFDIIRKVMRTYLVLTLLDFSQPFVLECDASIEGIGVVLM